MFFVLIVQEDGTCRTAVTSNLDSAIRKWRQRFGAFAVVAAAETDLDRAAFPPATRMPIAVAATTYRRLGVAARAQRAVFRQNCDKAGLLVAWARASLAVADAITEGRS